MPTRGQIALYAYQSGVGNALIRWWTNSPYSHVSWLPWGVRGPVWEAIYKKGVRYCETLAETASCGTRVDIYDLLDLEVWQRNEITEYYAAREGDDYDWKGIVSFVLRRVKQDPGAWFCSEILHAACNAAEYWLFGWNDQPWKTYPGMLPMSMQVKLSGSISY